MQFHLKFKSPPPPKKLKYCSKLELKDSKSERIMIMQKIFFFIPAWPWLKAVPRCRDFPPCPIHNWWTLSGRPAGSPWFCGRRNDSLGAWAGCWGCAVRWQCWGVGTGQPACLWSSREPRPESPTRSSMSSENRMKSQINVMPHSSMSSEIRGWKSQ